MDTELERTLQALADSELGEEARDAEIERLENRLREALAKLEATERELASARRREPSRSAGVVDAVTDAVTDAVAKLLKDHLRGVQALLAEAAPPSDARDEGKDEPYERRTPKRAKMDPDEKYRLLCQLAARARCHRKNLSPRARRRVVEQARKINALPEDDPLLE